jgi:DNA repair exonuclease SbcCD ATPase subunit
MLGSLTDEERAAMIAELQGKGKEERCATLEENIGNRNTYYAQSMESLRNNYEHMYQVLEAARERLSALGADVTSLDGLLTQLQEQMQTMTQLRTQLQTQLQAAYNYACDEQQEELHSIEVR